MHPVENEILRADLLEHGLDVGETSVGAAFIELAGEYDGAFAVGLEELGVLSERAAPEEQRGLGIVAEAFHSDKPLSSIKV